MVKAKSLENAAQSKGELMYAQALKHNEIDPARCPNSLGLITSLCIVFELKKPVTYSMPVHHCMLKVWGR
jgi:hypothetical protein